MLREMARAYPIISPLRELRHALSDLRLNDLSVGDDGSNRTPLGPSARRPDATSRAIPNSFSARASGCAA